MNRREFLKKIFTTTGAISLAGCSSVKRSRRSDEDVSFGISTDIHQDFIHDAPQRVSAYLKAAEKENVDFVIDLGDFCCPIKDNDEFVKIWRSSALTKYNVLGNHDIDTGTKQAFMNHFNMPNRYYSFDKGRIHFVVLDPNNLYIDGKYIPYANANFYRPSEQRAYVDPGQLEWLKNDLDKTSNHCIIFSHQSFEEPTCCKNQEQVRNIFENANKQAGFAKVIAAFSGHHHTDYSKVINGIEYIQINSMSYLLPGGEYKCPECFSDEINKRRTFVQYTMPYKDPLYAIVKIKNGNGNIKGVKSSFIKPWSIELEMNTDRLWAAKISDRKFVLSRISDSFR
jgi:hypothetical protein